MHGPLYLRVLYNAIFLSLEALGACPAGFYRNVRLDRFLGGGKE